MKLLVQCSLYDSSSKNLVVRQVVLRHRASSDVFIASSLSLHPNSGVFYLTYSDMRKNEKLGLSRYHVNVLFSHFGSDFHKCIFYLL